MAPPGPFRLLVLCPAASFLLAAAAMLTGWCAWRAWVHPAPAVHAFEFGPVARMTHPDGAPQAYFRKTLHLGGPVRHAWIAVSARDSFVLYVNGKAVAARQFASMQLGGVYEVSPYLAPGRNAIAVVSRRRSHPGPADLLVEGEVHEVAGPPRRIVGDASWRVAGLEPRWPGGVPWHSPVVDDTAWDTPALDAAPSASRRIGLPVAADAIVRPWQAQWLAHGPGTGASFTRTWEVQQAPTAATLRVEAAPGYLVVLNDVPIEAGEDLDELDEGLLASERASRWSGAQALRSHAFDVSAVIRRGTNTLTVMPGVANPAFAGLRAELILRDGDGVRTLGTDGTWLVTAPGGRRTDALPVAQVLPTATRGHALQMRSRHGTASEALVRMSALAACVLLTAALIGAVTALAARILEHERAADRTWAFNAAAACSLLLTMPLLLALLAGFDVRVDPRLPYQPWLLMSAALLWLVMLAALASGRRTARLAGAKGLA